jgi:hypothetical protein
MRDINWAISAWKAKVSTSDMTGDSTESKKLKNGLRKG